jgi:hypothetical protein
MLGKSHFLQVAAKKITFITYTVMNILTHEQSNRRSGDH